MLVRLSMIMLLVCSVAGRADAECNCVAVAGEVAASVQAEVAKADGLYARGDYNAALAIYAKAYATSKDPALLYAQGMANMSLGATAEAKVQLDAYVKAGGAYTDRAQAALAGGVVGGVTGTAALAEDTAGSVRGEVGAKTNVGKKAGIILGVIAIAAIGAVGVHSIAAGVSADIELDPKFDLGLGVAGVAVGISAIYVSGLTAATAAAPKCVAGPIALPGGGGVAAAMRF